MRFRTFAARLFGFRVEQPKARTPPASPLDDALTLLDCVYAGEPWSRRAWASRMAQPRWEAATELLRQAGVLDNRGRSTAHLSSAHDAAVLVREAYRRQQAMRANKNYVSPR